MSRILWSSVESRFHDRLDLIVLGALRTGLARWFVLKTDHSAFQEMIAPQNNGWPTGLQLSSDAPIGQAVMRQ